MIKCPKCGEELEEDAKFCTYCRAKIVSECPKCKKILKPNAKFCSECGTPLEEFSAEAKKPSICKKCKAELAPDDKFCSICGTPVDIEEKKYPQNLENCSLQELIELEHRSHDAEVQWRIGNFYKDTEKNYEEAFKWYKKSAEQGNPRAENNIGNCYFRGRGVETNYEEAFRYYKKSAKQGNAVGQYNLGVLYQIGKGTEKNYEEAFKWFTKSSEQGYEDAEEKLKELEPSNSEPEEDFSYKKDYARTKPNLNVGTIGHLGHGKTTLTAAITAYSARNFGTKEWSCDEIDSSPDEQYQGITINHHYLEYQSEHRHYTHIDCPGHADYVKNMITGTAQMDAAILVISAPDGGVMPQTLEHLRLARQAGIEKIVVFINKADIVEDQVMIELVLEEIKDWLESFGFSPDTPIIQGSAYKALNNPENPTNTNCIQDLLSAMDNWFDDCVRDEQNSFIMPISDIRELPNKGTVVTGLIESGIVKVGDSVGLVGINLTQNTYVTSIKIFEDYTNEAHAGNITQILLPNIKKKDVVRGQVLAAPGSIRCHSKFKANVYVLRKEEGGRHSPIFTGYRPQFYFRTADITGTVELTAEDMLCPGDNAKIVVELFRPIFMQTGQPIVIREGGRTIAIGHITKIID